MKRADWIDSCRFWAIFVIMTTHFLDLVSPEALMLWETPPSSWFLYGLTGKFSVAFFFVLLGYFASKSSVFNLISFVKYTIRRYLHFVFYIFICTLLFIMGSYCVTWIFHFPSGPVMQVISDGFRYNLIYLVRDSFLFESNYNATLWCMQQLFIASVVCKGFSYLSGRLSYAIRMLVSFAVIVILMVINAEFFIWICASILGYILRLCLEFIKSEHIKFNSFVLLLLFIAALFLIKFRLPEGPLQYSLQSTAAFLLIFIQFKLTYIQKILSTAPFPWLGSISIGLFITHTPIYSIFYCSVYPILLSVLQTAIAKFTFFIVSVCACIICSWMLKTLYSAFEKIFYQRKVSV